VTAPATLSEAGDSGLLIRLGDQIDEAGFLRVMAALAALDGAGAGGRLPGVIDVLPGYASLLLVFDPRQTTAGELRGPVHRLLAAAAATTVGGADAAPAGGRALDVPVLYDPAVAPDLLALAAEKAMTPDELVARHAAPRYRCHLVGFRPGFPFLGGLDPALAAPRLDTPRPRVAAGSVGIAGRQTGVYPGAGPGGWRIIGRTPLRLFDPARTPPALIAPGDRVSFVPIDRARFLALGGQLP
jgi:inhibitor of KinA